MDENLDHKTLINTTKNEKKTPVCTPTQFSGKFHENINDFLKKFDRASLINKWTEEDKILYLPIYLEGTALTFLENIENKTQNINWSLIEKKLRHEFEPVSQKELLRTLIDKKKQLEDESITSYLNEVESLCRRLDQNMSEKELVHHMLKGLRPEIARYISILDNNSTEDIKKNIRKYETVEFMISDSYINNPNSIKTSILKEQIQQIIQNTNTEVEELKNEIKKLKIEFIENNNKNISNKIDDEKKK